MLKVTGFLSSNVKNSSASLSVSPVSPNFLAVLAVLVNKS